MVQPSKQLCITWHGIQSNNQVRVNKATEANWFVCGGGFLGASCFVGARPTLCAPHNAVQLAWPRQNGRPCLLAHYPWSVSSSWRWRWSWSQPASQPARQTWRIGRQPDDGQVSHEGTLASGRGEKSSLYCNSRGCKHFLFAAVARAKIESASLGRRYGLGRSKDAMHY